MSFLLNLIYFKKINKIMKHKILLSILTLSISFPVFAEYKIMLNSEKIKIPEPTIPSLELNHTFTNCGKTGRFGPNENQCINEYNGQNILKEAFNFYVDNGYQIFTVNKNGIYNITAIGAQGGNGGTDSKIIRGGFAARVSGEFSLKKGDVVKVLIGQKGSTGIYNGNHFGGGGGGTYVSTINNEPLIVGAGGNGTNINYTGVSGSTEDGDGQGPVIDNFNSNKAGCGGGFYTNGQCSDYEGSDGESFINGGLGGATPTKVSPADGGFGGGSGVFWNASGAGGGYSGGVGANRPDETYQGVSAKSFNNGNNKVSSVYNSGGHGKVTIEYIQ